MFKPHLLVCTLLTLALWLFPLPGQIKNRALAQTSLTKTAPTAGFEERDRGIAFYRQKSYAEAAKFLKKAVAKNKDDEQSWYYLGLALMQPPKEIKNATRAFETAVRLKSNFAAARTGLSYAFLQRDKFSDALREAQAALKIDSGIANAHHIIAVVRHNTGAYEEALKEASEAIRLNPSLAAAYLVKSEALCGIYAEKVMEIPRAAPARATPLTPEEREERRRKRRDMNAPLKEAAESLEIYLRLNPSDPAAERWWEQLASLKVFTNLDGDKTRSETVAFGFEVTTKARVLAKPEPVYNDEALNARVRGTVVLQAVFAADGTVRNFLILKGLPHGLTESAIQAARHIKFTPAMIDGKPVSMFIQLEYNFNM